jgi:hypothetical protein
MGQIACGKQGWVMRDMANIGTGDTANDTNGMVYVVHAC